MVFLGVGLERWRCVCDGEYEQTVSRLRALIRHVWDCDSPILEMTWHSIRCCLIEVPGDVAQACTHARGSVFGQAATRSCREAPFRTNNIFRPR